MAVVTVNLLDTFDQWRLKTNDLGVNLGDLTSLTTTDKTNIVAALNEVLSGDSDDMENVVDDTTPQLGGDLDFNSFNITGTGNINITGDITATSIAGTVIGVTQSVSDNSTKLATTAYAETAATNAASASTVTGLSDTTITSLADQDFLQWNASASVWQNINEPTGVTQSSGDNTTKLATTAFVQTVASAAAGGVNTDIITDTTPQLGGDLDLNSKIINGSGSIAGTILGVTQTVLDNSTKLATTAYAETAATNAANLAVSSSVGDGDGLVFAIALG